jgi:exodeoxyribonuclease VII large subunit
MSDSSYSIGQLTLYIREMFEANAHLQQVWVQGEVSNMKRASSGHWYFTLKDREAQLKCVMWRSSAERQSFRPEDGDSILAHGSVGVYEPQGVYQLYADRVRPVGTGDLYAQFERIKQRLEAEGLFDPARKRPIPLFPQYIGVVTSPEAAAFQDIQQVLRRRYPLAQIILSPTLVQGNDAPRHIIYALDRLNRDAQVDVILMIRGGGSIEDLWAFNDEDLARAVAHSRIPVITGVGHETDFTIVDFVSDLRAPTPSAAAEVATPNRDDLRASLEGAEQALITLMQQRLTTHQSRLEVIRRSLGHLSPRVTIRNQRQRLDDTLARLTTLERAHLRLLRERIHGKSAALSAADPRAILQRGYAIVTRRSDGMRLQSAAAAPAATLLTIQLAQGQLNARVETEDSA